MAVTAYLYDAEGRDREIDPTPQALQSLEDKQLLWIDCDSRDEKDLRGMAELLAIQPATIAAFLSQPPPKLESVGDYVHFGVETAPGTSVSEHSASPGGNHNTRLDFVVGSKWLLTVHDGRLHFIDSFRDRDEAEKTIGALTTHDFAATLLDAHLEAFFDEIARIEAMVDRLDEQALVSPSSRTLLGRMVSLRRRVSRLRSALTEQRGVFYGLSRPDLQGVAEAGAAPHFQVLVGRFERAIDEVEHTRDLVVGSFEIFASRTAQQTNELVKVLTYLTAVVGICAAVAGIFGMNFTTDFFETGDKGFYITIAILSAIIVTATGLARWRGWI